MRYHWYWEVERIKWHDLYLEYFPYIKWICKKKKNPQTLVTLLDEIVADIVYV